jgi:hypothetical protein
VGMIGDASDKTPITSVCLRARIEMVPIWGGFDPDWVDRYLLPETTERQDEAARPRRLRNEVEQSRCAEKAHCTRSAMPTMAELEAHRDSSAVVVRVTLTRGCGNAGHDGEQRPR